MHKLIDYACDELEELEKKAAKGNLSAAEIEYAEKLASLKKNLLKGDKLYNEMEMDYSGAMMPMSYARGQGQGGGNSNRGGGSYAYARGRGSNARRDSMGRYSREGGYSREADEMVEKLYDLMDSAPDDSTRKDIERLIHKVEQM